MGEWTNVIAVVDDDPDVLSAIHRLLSAHGYGTELYRSAPEFLTAAPASRASCAIVDVHLGSDNGISLVHQLREGGFTLPVIFITGSDDEANRQRALDAGCIGFICKPFIADALIAGLADARRVFG